MSQQTNKMTEARAKEIALEICKYEAARRDMTIDPHHDELTSKAKRLQIDPELAKQFFVETLIPITLGAATNHKVIVKMEGRSALPTAIQRDIALTLVVSRGVDLAPASFSSRCERMSKETSVSAEEIVQFYLEIVMPRALGRIKGANRVSIVTSTK